MTDKKDDLVGTLFELNTEMTDQAYKELIETLAKTEEHEPPSSQLNMYHSAYRNLAFIFILLSALSSI